ncbi:MAG: type II toxin-antitoxin system VapC family toxin [Terracidiphilus sp.]
MKLLLDTHLLLWASEKSVRLSADAKKLISDPANDLFFSVASIWEIAIKYGKGTSGFSADPVFFRSALLANGYMEMDIVARHVVAIGSLPPIHKDPFDRLLIAQAMVEGMTFATTDAKVARYPGPIRKV